MAAPMPEDWESSWSIGLERCCPVASPPGTPSWDPLEVMPKS